MRAPRSIRLRLALWYVLLLAVVLGAFSAGIYLTLRHSLYTSLDDSVEVRTEDLLAVVRVEGSKPTLDGEVPSNSSDEGEQFIRVFDASGAITFDTSAAAGKVSTDQEALRAALVGTTIAHDVDGEHEMFRARLTPIRRDGQVIGALEFGRSKGDVSDTLRTLLLVLSISYPVTIALASFGGIFLAGRALSPIDRLTRLARRLSAEDLSQRLDLELPDDEVGRLARTFDDMLERLDDAFQRQRQFTADASHELRTPLTAIKGQVEVTLSRQRSVGDYQEVLHAVNEEVDRLIRLVGSLLTLARADAGQIPLALEPVDLPQLVGSAVDQIRPIAGQRGVDMRIEPGPAVTLQADEDLLLQLLLNLLDNAVKYTPAGGSVTAGWGEAAGCAELWVS
ncbi:MAG: histidine kinase dimerization/phospho-acceptor domain-containing protein, partial [Dehalococcoidia bacterium]